MAKAEQQRHKGNRLMAKVLGQILNGKGIKATTYRQRHKANSSMAKPPEL